MFLLCASTVFNFFTLQRQDNTNICIQMDNCKIYVSKVYAYACIMIIVHVSLLTLEKHMEHFLYH